MCVPSMYVVHRSALKPLGDCNLALVRSHSNLVVKANVEPRYQMFEEEAKDLVDGLQNFTVRASTVCAEADTMTEMSDDSKMEGVTASIAKLIATAESHKIGALKAVSRFEAMCG